MMARPRRQTVGGWKKIARRKDDQVRNLATKVTALQARNETLDRERKYFLREGHLFGFMTGLVLSQWVPLAIVWGIIVVTLWAQSLWHTRRTQEIS